MYLDFFANSCMETHWAGLFGYHFAMSCEEILESFVDKITIECGGCCFMVMLENPVCLRRWELLHRSVRRRVIGKIVWGLRKKLANINEEPINLGICVMFVRICALLLEVDRDLLGYWVDLGEMLAATDSLWLSFATEYDAMSRLFDVYGFLIGQGPHVRNEKQSELQVKLAVQMYGFTRLVVAKGLVPQMKKQAVDRCWGAFIRLSQKNRKILSKQSGELLGECGDQPRIILDDQLMIATIYTNQHSLNIKTNRQSIRACFWCLKSKKNAGVILKRCGGCRAVYYCSQKCQKKGWKNGHKTLCYPMKMARTQTSHVAAW